MSEQEGLGHPGGHQGLSLQGELGNQSAVLTCPPGLRPASHLKLPVSVSTASKTAPHPASACPPPKPLALQRKPLLRKLPGQGLPEAGLLGLQGSGDTCASGNGDESGRAGTTLSPKPSVQIGCRGQGASAERDHLQPVSSGTSESEEQVKVWRRPPSPSPSLLEGSLSRLEPRASVCLWGQGGPELGGWAQKVLLPLCATPQQALLTVPLALGRDGVEVQLAGDWGS